MTRYLIPHASNLPHPLGRHVNHDPQSRLYPFTAPHHIAQTERVAVDWSRRVPIFDQGSLGSCTGNAAAGWVGTDDTRRGGADTLLSANGPSTPVNEDFAVAIYSRATQLDPFDGAYPPEDTGSDGLSVAKVLKELGEVERYEHCFTVDAFLDALQLGPVLVGIPWHDGMFTPDEDGEVEVSGPVVGGHEIIAVGYDPGTRKIKFANSWGAEWGDAGFFYMHDNELAKLLADDGDATVLYATVPADPEPVDPQQPGDDSELPAWFLRFVSGLIAALLKLIGSQR